MIKKHKTNTIFKVKKIVFTQLILGTFIINVAYAENSNEIANKLNTSIAVLSKDSAFEKITGQVVDDQGNTLPGVNIMKKGSTTGVSTDLDGNFTIDANKGDILIFSYIGFLNQEIIVDSKTNIKVVLESIAASLDDVVVVGYGKQKKEQIVGAVSTVKGQDLKFATRSLSNNIAGQVSGLLAIQRSGEPGYDNSEFWIRGISTFAGGSQPLVLVDGVPRAINDIEPDEIETFSVLKDAASTAVYGAEGANGVIIITSKRGKAQKPVISFRTEHSISQPTRLPKFVNSADYLDLYNESLRNDGESPIYSDELIAKYRSGEDLDLYPNTDWMGAMLKNFTENHR